MNRSILALLLAVPMLSAAVAAPEPQRARFVDLFNQANEAHDAKDYARMEKLLREALAQRPFHPTALYNLAAAFALRGNRDDAVDTLRTLGRMGLVYEPDKDPDFASIRNDAGFGLVVSGMKGNRSPVGHPTIAFRLKNPSLVPEGMAYDENTNSYFVSSVRERRIQRVKSEEEHDFVQPGAGGLWSALGMNADSKRRLLWVATAALPEMKDAEVSELGQSGLIAYDLDSGAPKKRLLLPADGAKHDLGDVIVTPDGAVYTTDSAGGVLYALNKAQDAFVALTKPGELASPQGLVLSRDKRLLFIADYSLGLFRYDLEDKKLRRMDVDREICVYGIDGLYRFDKDLIAVQNGIRPHRIVRFRLERGGDRVVHAQVLAANRPEFEEPTLGVIVGKRFSFIANSQWDRFDKNHQLPPDDQLKQPMILRLTLVEEPNRFGDQGFGPSQSAPGPQSPGLQLPPVSVPPIR